MAIIEIKTKTKRQKITSVSSKDVQKLEHSCTVGGTVKSCNAMEQYGGASKIKNRTII